MSQSCGKVGDSEKTKEAKESMVNHDHSLQADIGEQVAAEYALNTLNLKPEFYDSPRTGEKGIDLIYRDSTGTLVLADAKFTIKSASASLAMTKHCGREGSVEWITYHAELMCDKTSSRYSPDNAKLGAEILRVGAENVHFIVIHTDPRTLTTDDYRVR